MNFLATARTTRHRIFLKALFSVSLTVSLAVSLTGCLSRESTVCQSPSPGTQGLSLQAPCKRVRTRVEGTLEVWAVDRKNSKPGFEYSLLSDAGVQYGLEFASAPPRLRTGDRLQATGWIYPCLALGEIRKGSALLIEDPEVDVLQLSAALPRTFGEQETAVILMEFTDLPAADTPSAARATIFEQVNNFFLEASYGRTSIVGSVFGPFTSTLSSTVCDPDALADQAKSMARDAGADLRDFTRFVYVFPKNACGWFGLGTIGGDPSQAWINGSLELQTVAHELGHNLGLHHSNALSCDESGCLRITYGDLADAMGNGSAAHFNAFQKERLGWLTTDLSDENSPKIRMVDASGVFEIEPYSRFSFGTKALKVLQAEDEITGAKTFYYIEYRQPEGHDSVLGGNLSEGILLHTGSTRTADSSYLLHMNPMESWLQAALEVSRQYLDAVAGVSFSLQSADPNRASVEILIDRSERFPSTSCSKTRHESGITWL